MAVKYPSDSGSRRTRPEPNVKIRMNDASWARLGLVFLVGVLVALIVGFFVSSNALSPLDLL